MNLPLHVDPHVVKIDPSTPLCAVMLLLATTNWKMRQVGDQIELVSPRRRQEPLPL